MKLNSLSVSDVTSILFRFLHRYHVMLFVVITLGGLAVATYVLNGVVSSASVITNVNSSTAFDQQTIDKIMSFKTSSQQHGQYTPPAGRSNPFAE